MNVLDVIGDMLLLCYVWERERVDKRRNGWTYFPLFDILS